MEPSVKKFRGRLFIMVMTVCLLFGISMDAQAQDTDGKFRIQPSVFFGFGASKVDVGVTTTGDIVSISGGGGAGGGITFGYGLARRLDIAFSAGYQESELSQQVANATGSFDRTFFLFTMMYRIPVSNRFHIKVGGGAGFYQPGELDIDASKVANGGHSIIKYDNAAGAHVLAEVEVFVAKGMAVNIGVKYYSVTYHESSATRNGAPVYFTDSNIENLDGSGTDLMLSFAKYF